MEFVQYFKDNYCGNKHFIINVENGYSIIPMSQLDWSYNITEYNGIWYVSGYKNDIFDYLGQQKSKYQYKNEDGKWICINYSIDYLLDMNEFK